jgi:hypothetical protein
VYDVNKNLKIERKPPKPKNSDGQDSLSQHFIDKSRRRPSSARSGDSWSSCPVSSVAEDNKDGEQVPDNLKPSVYGYQFKRQVYGSNPDIFSEDGHEPVKQDAVMFKLDESAHKKSSSKEKKMSASRAFSAR